MARLAELNARTCDYHHDECHATGRTQVVFFITRYILTIAYLEKFPYAGQNIARRGTTDDYENPDAAIAEMMIDWFTEYKNADMSYIKSFHRPNHR